MRTLALSVTAALLATPLHAQAPVHTYWAQFPLTSTSEQAKTEFRMGYREAINAFGGKGLIHADKALALDPQFGLAWIFRGTLRTTAGDSARQQDFVRGLALLAKATPAEQLLGLAWREQFSARQPLARTLVSTLHDMLPNDPDVAYMYYALGNVGKSQAEAMANLREGIRKYPDMPIAYRSLGYGLAAMGDMAGGVEMMREHVRREPNHANAHESMAEVLQKAGQLDEAAREDERALQLDSSFTGAFTHLADLKLVSGDVAKAREYWAKARQYAIAAGGDSANAVHSAAVSYLAEGNPREAVARLTQLVPLVEANHTVNNGVALASLTHQELAVLDALYGNGRSVDGHLTRAAEVLGDVSVPANRMALFRYSAIAYGASKQLDKARDAAVKYSEVAAGPNVAGRHTLNGFIAIQTNDYQTALTELPQADANDLLAKELLAEVHLKQGRAAEARALREKVKTGSALIYASGVTDMLTLIAKARAAAPTP